MLHLEFQGTSLTRRVGNPSIHGMLEYSEKTGVVRTLIKGGAAFHQMLASEFATHVLGQIVDAKRIKPEKLDFNKNGSTTPYEWAAALLAAKQLKLGAGLVLSVAEGDKLIDKAEQIYIAANPKIKGNDPASNGCRKL